MTSQAAEERVALNAALATLLATLTLAPLVAGKSWLVVAAIAVIAVMVTGMVGRSLLRWWPMVALLQALALLLVLVVLFVRSEALAGPVPGAAAVPALVDLLRAGLDVTRQQGPPVEATQGVVLLVVGGAGLVALAVDVLAASLRHPALAGLPLLGMYCVPAALLADGLPWYYFALAAFGFLALLSADAGDRVRGWGRVLTGAPGSRGRPATDGMDGLARGGRRVGVTAVALAAVLPVMVPGLGNQVLSGAQGGGNGGNAPIRTINPILNLRRDLTSGDDSLLLTYRSSVASPEPLRIVTADIYDGSTWSPHQGSVPKDNRVQAGLPAAPGLTLGVATTAATTAISVQALDQTYLPLPYPARRVDIEGNWYYDAATLNVVGDRITTRGRSYTVNHLVVTPTPQQLEGSGAGTGMDTYLKLPVKLPTSIRQTASAVTETARTNYERAVLLQRWFTDSGQFEYDTRAPVDPRGDGSTDAIAEFLQVKRGYCVHFASAMAVMARTLGIPARVAVGFLPGDKQPEGDWVIRAKDAHAWPELYFEGVGWTRFEPTPRSNDATAVPPSWSVPPPGVMPGDDLPSASASVPRASTSSSAAARRPEAGQPAATTTSLGDRLAALPWRLIGVLALVALVAAAPLTADRLSRRRRWRRAGSPAERAEAAWEDLRRGLEDLGVRWASSWTPRALRHRLVADLGLGPDHDAAAGRLVADLEAARYARPGGSAGRPASQMRADVRMVLAAVAAGAPAGVRRRARWFPPSGVSGLRELGRRADAAGDRAGRLVNYQVGEAGRRVRESVGAGRRRDGGG